jgi:hypothetical protein
MAKNNRASKKQMGNQKANKSAQTNTESQMSQADSDYI